MIPIAHKKASTLMATVIIPLLVVVTARSAESKGVPLSRPESSSDMRVVFAVPTVPEKPSSFAAMDALDRDAILREIQRKPFPQILDEFVRAERVDHDPMKQVGVANILIEVLRERPVSPEFWETLRNFILSDSNPKNERLRIFASLAKTATTESVEVFFAMSDTMSDPEMRQAAANYAGFISDTWGYRDHEELSPLLENRWRSATDRGMIGALGTCLARIGATTGIEALLKDALGPVGFRREIARYALVHGPVLNPHAVAPIEAVLLRERAGTDSSLLASDALNSIGMEPSGKALIAWIRKADGSIAPTVQGYVAHARTDIMLKLWNASLDPAVTFRSERNREAIRAGLAEYHSYRKTG